MDCKDLIIFFIVNTYQATKSRPPMGKIHWGPCHGIWQCCASFILDIKSSQPPNADTPIGFSGAELLV